MARSPTIRRRRRRRRNSRLPSVAVESSERALLEARARSAGISLSSYIRRAALGRRLPRPVPAINRETCARLGWLGARFNQNVEAIQQGHAPAAHIDLLEELRRELAALRRELVGEVDDDAQDR
jgi:hypothetical protein